MSRDRIIEAQTEAIDEIVLRTGINREIAREVVAIALSILPDSKPPKRTKCSSWKGHNFIPRYVEVTPDIQAVRDMVSELQICTADGMKKVIESLTKKVYVGDVCSRCGEFRKYEGGPCER